MVRSSRVRPFQVTATSTRSPPTDNGPPSAAGFELRTNRCVKYTMFFKNMLFLLCGVLLGTVGFVALKEKDKLNGKFDSLFLDPAAILFAVGVVVFVISFCGALGALRENKCLLRFFYVSIIIIIILEASLVFVLYAYRAKMRLKVDGIFKQFILDYHDDHDLQFVVDYVQIEVGCCGSKGCQDWQKNPYYNCSNEGIVSACSVPYSCCKEDRMNRMCGGGVLWLEEDERSEKVYTVGCLDELENWIMARVKYAAIVFGCLLILQLVAVRLAFWMISDINCIIKWRDSH